MGIIGQNMAGRKEFYIHGKKRRVEEDSRNLRGRSWRVVLAEGDLLDRHVLNTVGIGLELIDVKYQDITLDLLAVLAGCFCLKFHHMGHHSRPSGRSSGSDLRPRANSLSSWRQLHFRG